MSVAALEQNKPATAGRLLFFDFVRNAAMLSVIMYHVAGAYSTMALWWSVHDRTSILADFVRQVFDVFIMPVFFFISGYFCLSSFNRKGLGAFLGGKLKRLGIPWLLLMLTIVPISVYRLQPELTDGTAIKGFWNYWVSGYIGSFGQIRLSMLPSGQSNQMHFWYISLLLFFFIAAGLLYHTSGKIRGRSPDISSKPGKAAPVLLVLLLFGVLTSAVNFIANLIFPDFSWVTINLLLQFQPTKVCMYALYFGLGIFAYSRQWFTKDAFAGRPAVWVFVCILLTAGYLAAGQEVFAHPGDSQLLPKVTLLIFAVLRSFLCLAITVMLISFASSHANRSLAINRELAAQSFNIYLVHLFVVVMLQGILTAWEGGTVPVKMEIALSITVPVSYWISRFISRFPFVSAAGLLCFFALAALGMR